MPDCPVPGDRIARLDVLRGIALAGIVLMNIEGMAGPPAASGQGVDPTLSGADRAVDTLVYLLVQGKFYPLFSLLFGMGFAIMLARATQDGRAFAPRYLRRLLALALIGLAHAVLVWPGDILLTYALTAVPLLVFFRDTSARRLWAWAVALMLLPCALVLAAGLGGSSMQATTGLAGKYPPSVDALGAEFAQQVDAQREAYGHGSYAAATAQRVSDLGTLVEALPVLLPFVLGLFVLGAWFVRSGAITRPDDHAGLYVCLRGPVLLAGAVLTLVSWWMMPSMDPARVDVHAMLAYVLHMNGGVLMALGYMAWIIRCAQGAAFAGIFARLAPAGRMALTNYLMQSLLLTTLFYGYGFGLFEQLPRAWQTLLAVGVFVLQVLASAWWMRRFRLGPVEWVWRWITYGARPRLRIG